MAIPFPVWSKPWNLGVLDNIQSIKNQIIQSTIMADLKTMAESLVNLTVKEVNELAEILKDEHGIEPAAAAVVSAAGPSGGGEGGLSLIHI